MQKSFTVLLTSLLVVSASAFAGVAGEVAFVSGDAHVGTLTGESLRAGVPVNEGDALRTGKDGHLYVRLVDRGILILRPNSSATVSDYLFQQADPAQSRMRIDVSSGVVRSVTGKWGKAAPSQYRMNTPVAALGVRGTDFTVFVTPDTTRAAVTAGGIVMTPLGGGCRAQDVGPCDGSSSAELFAGNPNLALQQTSGSARPVLIDTRDKGLHPNSVAPPLPQEEGAGQASKTAGSSLSLDSRTSEALPTDVVTSGTTAPQVVWGRWETLLDPNAAAAIRDGRTMVAANSQFGLFRDDAASVTMPLEWTASFNLASYESFFQETGTNRMIPAQIDHAVFSVDFGSRTFATSFNMEGGGLATQVNAKGGLFPDGRFVSSVVSSDASVAGALAGDKASEAAYVFHKPVAPNVTAYGATYWTR